MLPPTVFRLSAWARSCTVGLKWASSSHELQHRDSTCCYETNQHKPVCVLECMVALLIVRLCCGGGEEKRREKEKENKAEMKGEERGKKRRRRETFKRRMHSVVQLVCGASAEYTCVVLLLALWVAEYCVIFRTWDMTCVYKKIKFGGPLMWLTKSCPHMMGHLFVHDMAILAHYAAVSLCSQWSVWRDRERRLPIFVHWPFNVLFEVLPLQKAVCIHTFSPKEEYFSFLLVSSLYFHVQHAHRPLPPTQQQFPDQFLKLAG